MAGMIAQASTAPMTRKEARLAMLHVRQGMRECRLLLLELYERGGWRVMGYASWREFCRIEFEESERHLYRLLQAAQVERDVAQGGAEIPAGGIPERQARELARLPTGELRRAVYAEAADDGPVTAEKISDLVDAHQGHARTEKLRLVNDQAEADQVEPAPAAAAGLARDPIAVILLRCQDARRYHRDLGDRSRAADAALDEYLRVVRG